MGVRSSWPLYHGFSVNERRPLWIRRIYILEITNGCLGPQGVNLSKVSVAVYIACKGPYIRHTYDIDQPQPQFCVLYIIHLLGLVQLALVGVEVAQVVGRVKC